VTGTGGPTGSGVRGTGGSTSGFGIEARRRSSNTDLLIAIEDDAGNVLSGFDWQGYRGSRLVELREHWLVPTGAIVDGTANDYGNGGITITDGSAPITFAGAFGPAERHLVFARDNVGAANATGKVRARQPNHAYPARQIQLRPDFTQADYEVVLVSASPLVYPGSLSRRVILCFEFYLENAATPIDDVFRIGLSNNYDPANATEGAWITNGFTLPSTSFISVEQVHGGSFITSPSSIPLAGATGYQCRIEIDTVAGHCYFYVGSLGSQLALIYTGTAAPVGPLYFIAQHIVSPTTGGTKLTMGPYDLSYSRVTTTPNL
jgi:hypothetical protein